MRSNVIFQVVAVLLTGCSLTEPQVDNYKAQGDPYFQMSDNLACRIEASSRKKEIGETVSLIALKSEKPKALFSRSGTTSPMEKLFETDKTLVI